MVTVYTSPSCRQCRMTTNLLDKNGIEYESISLAEHPETADEFRNRGLTQAPVVVTDTDTWFGFRPDKIASIQH